MIFITPAGNLHAAETSPPITAAFARGTGYGVLHLALEHIDAQLEPDLGWLRELGRAFLTQACAIHDLETQRARLDLAPPGEELQALVAATPPLPGAEYVDAALTAGARTAAQRWSPRAPPRS